MQTKAPLIPWRNAPQVTGSPVYAATPYRMEYLVGQICNFIESQNRFPVQPLLLLPPGRFTYERHTRENISKVCFGLVDYCPETWIFGIGGGALTEYARAKSQGKPVRSYVKMFDEHWEEWVKREKYKNGYKDLVDEVLATSL